MISPLTGELIPASKLQEHLRISLLDPRWREQRDRERREKQEQEAVFAHGQFVEHNLKQLAERRTDIFGVGQEETAIGRKVYSLYCTCTLYIHWYIYNRLLGVTFNGFCSGA